MRRRPHFDVVYFSTGGVLEVGLSAAPGFSITFMRASDVISYLPAFGTPGALNANLVNPTSSASGYFGGEVVALTLNIDFADAGHTLGADGIRFRDLRL
jgi:hypothetical protein